MAKEYLESKYVEVTPSVELHYWEQGAGKPLVFIPGLTFSGEIFKAQIAHFSKAYRVIAIDPRGQGFSSKTADGNDYLTHGRDLHGLMTALDLHDAVLIGWSTGNLDAWSYVQQFGKDKLRGIVTIDMSPLPMSPDPTCWTEGSIEELSEVASQILSVPSGPRDFFSGYTTDIMIQRDVPAEELSYILDMSCRTPYWICKALFCDAMFCNFLETAQDLGANFPSLMFIAEHWADVAKPFVEEKLPGYDHHVMGGHLMFYEYPDTWNAVLEGFLDKL
ncbi:alpha/beta hydrolase [Bengtsoniella intestinalis]|uniref:alpha/beta fold hydrolase n=1 Tax=Bengtsoniella intestinalis TaxID=3073143 RepID=UPI00391F51D7